MSTPPTGTAQPSHRRGSAVADRVLDCTLALLAEQGYEFSVDQVAARAEVHKTTIYRRWETKPALVAAAVERLADVHVTVPETDDPLTALVDLAVQVARALQQPAGVNALRAALTSAGADPELGATAGRFLASRYRAATPLVEAAQEAGLLRADVDPGLVWQAIVNPLHINAVTGAPFGEDVARQLAELVLRGARP